CDDTLSILISTSGKDSLIGRPIVQIDEQSAREYAQASAYRIYYHDIGVQSTEEEELVLLGAYSASRYPEANSQTTNTITFADGTTAIMGFLELNKINRIMRINDGYKRISTWRRLNTSRNPDDVYEMRQINDSTSLLSLKTFVLNEIQLDSLLGWLRRCQSDNLIIDLRNNSGGDANVTNRLLSVFAQKPLNRQKGGYSMVKSRGHFQSFAHSLNYTQAVNSDIFPEYEAREGMEGFYLNDSLETVAAVYPDTLTQYTGKVYVLTNGNSCSAATLFPAVLVRNRRGVTVGRETRTGYHSMAALKFAQIRLPNSLYTINVPMVRCVFDTTICDRTPARRGLLPDYPLRLTRHEVMMGNDGQTDVMLDYTLSLIAQGLYLSPEDPFATADTPPTPKYPVHWGVIALVGATAILFIMLWIKRKKAKN
ncbi:MAG TPA: S41 family peptidase, partial [Salinivirgaceae bacterium]|nr:S41 family peptidase [Salinivirgaceae bacterium]